MRNLQQKQKMGQNIRRRFRKSKFTNNSMKIENISASNSEVESSQCSDSENSQTDIFPVVESTSSDDNSSIESEEDPLDCDNRNNRMSDKLNVDCTSGLYPQYKVMSSKVKNMFKGITKLNVGESISLKFPRFPKLNKLTPANSTEDTDSSILLGFEESWYVELTLVAGKRLYVNNDKEKTEPMVKFYYNGNYSGMLTSVISDPNPMWNETFIFRIDSQKDKKSITFNITDQITHKDIGKATLEIKDVSQSEYKNYNLNVQGSNAAPNKVLVVRAKIVHASAYKSELLSGTSGLSDNQAFSYISKRTKDTAVTGKRKISAVLASVSVILISGKNFFPINDSGSADIYLKIKLGKEKAASRVAKKTLNPEWFQEFTLPLLEGVIPTLHVTAFHYEGAYKNYLVGRAEIDLWNLSQETSHRVVCELDDSAGIVEILITISGVDGNEVLHDAFNDLIGLAQMQSKYNLWNSLKDLDDVGCLYVKVTQAQNILYENHAVRGLFCTVQLLNSRVQTQKEAKKTSKPEWNKTFVFNITDIHWPVEIAVKFINDNKKEITLGHVWIPLLKIINGQIKWYGLKDSKLESRTGGSIELRMHLEFNHLRAFAKSVVPKDVQYCQVLDRKLTLADILTMVKSLKTNLARVNFIAEKMVSVAFLLDSSFEWSHPGVSCAFFMVFVTIAFCFELYMAPLALIIILATTYVRNACREIEKKYDDDMASENQTLESSFAYTSVSKEDSSLDEDDKEKLLSWKERFNSARDVILNVQTYLDTFANHLERVATLLNWEVPWLTMTLLILLVIGCVLLYFIPLRYVIIGYLINKYTKIIIRPGSLNNIEALDLLSRSHTMVEVDRYKEVRVLNTQ